MANTEVQKSGLDKKVPWLFFMDTFAQQLGIQVTLQFMNMFMTNFLLMTPLVVASILSIGRIVDMLVSTVSGSIVQKGNLKTGPLRTYIAINGPLLAIGNLFIFLNPNIAEPAKFALFIVGYCFRNLPQSFLITASNALVPKVAGSNMNDRLALTAKKTQGTSSAAIFTSMATIPLIEYFNTTVGNGRGYLIVGLLYCAIQTCVGLMVYFWLAPYDQYDPDAKKVEGSSVNVKVAHMYGDTLKNPQVWILMTSALIAQIASFTLSPLNSYYYTYVIGDIKFMALTTTVGAFSALAWSFISPRIAKKLGKRNSYRTAYFLSAVGYLGIVIFARGNYPAFLFFTIWNRLSLGISTTVGINIWGDAAEYQLFKTGRDSRPFIMSLQSLMMKVGQLISSFTYAAVLQFCNFEALGQGKANLDVNKLHFGLYGFLMCSYLMMGVLYMFFGISEEKSKEYAESNKKMLEERAAAVATTK